MVTDQQLHNSYFDTGKLNHMTGKNSQCGSCGKYFESRTLLRRHIDLTHRITNARIGGDHNANDEDAFSA
jgi:hypothetical protein